MKQAKDFYVGQRVIDGVGDGTVTHVHDNEVGVSWDDVSCGQICWYVDDEIEYLEAL